MSSLHQDLLVFSPPPKCLHLSFRERWFIWHFDFVWCVLILCDALFPFCHFSPKSTATLSSPRVFAHLIQGQVPWDTLHPCNRSQEKSVTVASQRVRPKPQHLHQTLHEHLWPHPLLLLLRAQQMPAVYLTQILPVLFMQVGENW